MRWILYALVLAWLLPLSARSEVLGEIPFQYRDGLMWLKVRVAGASEPLNFLIDSGAGVSVLDLGTAQRLGVKRGTREVVQGVNGSCAAYRVAPLRATSGGVALPLSALALDLSALSGCCHQVVDGMLGADFFRGRIVQIDFAAGRVRVLNGQDVNPVNGETLPVKRCNGAFCVPVRVAGHSAQWIRLDTGCDTNLEWAPTGLGDNISTARPSVSVRRIDTSVQLGTQRFAAVATGIHHGQLFAGEAGLLGNGLLSKFRLTLDEPRSTLRLERVR